MIYYNTHNKQSNNISLSLYTYIYRERERYTLVLYLVYIYIYIYIYYVYIYIHMYMCVYIYIYIHTYIGSRRRRQGWKPLREGGRRNQQGGIQVCCLRFVSDWTQPLDILSADSEFVCFYLSKKVPGQPNPWNTSSTANSCYANWVYPSIYIVSLGSRLVNG